MDKLPIILFALAFLTAITAATGIPSMRELKRKRAKRFKVICENWLKDINLAAADPSCDTGGSDFFSASEEVYERKFGTGWLVRYPLTKRYPDLGLTAKVDLIIHVCSIVPGADGTIDTVFVNLAEPTPRWWNPRYRIPAFPKIISLIYATKGPDRKFAYTSVLSDTLVPR